MLCQKLVMAALSLKSEYQPKRAEFSSNSDFKLVEMSLQLISELRIKSRSIPLSVMGKASWEL
jgi:hypothetical protein